MTREEYRAKQRRPMRLAAFRHAWHGLRVLCATQPNARFHLVATLGALAAGVCFRLAAWEWSALVLAIVGVWAVEALNTAIEFTIDLVSPEPHFLAGWAKDVAAGAVLVVSVGAVVVGCLVFGPHLWAWWAR
jgi:diacylglycerol kinase (ATP)